MYASRFLDGYRAMSASGRKLTMPNSDDDTPDVKPAIGTEALPTGNSYSPLSDRRGKATAEAIPDNDGSDPLLPPVDARRRVSKDATEADSK
jgi:hypothetical protein